MSEITATRIKPSWRAGTIVVCAALIGLSVWAGYELWQTSVPDGLRLPRLDPRNYFTSRELRRSASFERFGRIEWIGVTGLELVALGLLATQGRRLADAFALGRVGKGVMVGVFATLVLWLVDLPLGIADLWWERRHGLARQDYGSRLLESFLALQGQVAAIAVAVTVLMLLAGRLPRAWWVPAAPLFVGIGALVAFVGPLFAVIGTHRVRDRALAAQITSLARREGVPRTKVRVEKVSNETRAVNAETTGFGPTTVVLIWDTLLDGRYSAGEIRVIAAHELGHVAHRHVLKTIGWAALLTPVLLLVVAEGTRGRGGLARPEVVPFALLALTVVGLAVLPLENAISRRYEAEADWSALQATRDAASARRLFRDFSRTDLVQPRPPTWSYVMLENHPTLLQRLAMVEAWKRKISYRPAGPASRGGS
jgi:STE24 endopeptidase